MAPICMHWYQLLGDQHTQHTPAAGKMQLITVSELITVSVCALDRPMLACGAVLLCCCAVLLVHMAARTCSKKQLKDQHQHQPRSCCSSAPASASHVEDATASSPSIIENAGKQLGSQSASSDLPVPCEPHAPPSACHVCRKDADLRSPF